MKNKKIQFLKGFNPKKKKIPEPPGVKEEDAFYLPSENFSIVDGTRKKKCISLV